MRGAVARCRWLGLGLVVLLVVLGPARVRTAATARSIRRRPGRAAPRAVVVLLEELGADVDLGGSGIDEHRRHRPHPAGPPRRRGRATGSRTGSRTAGCWWSPIRSRRLHDDEGYCPAAVARVGQLSLGRGGGHDSSAGDDCFAGFVSAVDRGDGTIVSVDQPTVFVNALLGDEDNAVLAAALLAPTGERGRGVRRRDDRVRRASRCWDLLGPRAAQAIVQLAVAFVLVRAVAGPPARAGGGRAAAGHASPARSSSLPSAGCSTPASGPTRSPPPSAPTCCASLELRLGVPAGGPVETVAAAVAARTGLDPAQVAAALARRSVLDERDLLEVVDDLDRIRALSLVPATRRDHRSRRNLMPPAPTRDPRTAVLALRDEVGKVVVGQDGTMSGLVAALLVRGHVLLEGVPGVAKTLVVKTLARALDLEFSRVQFTPDLMPSDVLGQVIFEAKTGDFRFRQGPVFTNVLLADEINRTPPKTQAALLEAMEERQVSIDGEPHALPEPFVVVATQNPVEYEGTYPLPEAQLDRFLFKLQVTYPTAEQEVEVLARHDRGLDPHDLEAAGVRAVARPGRPRRRPCSRSTPSTSSRRCCSTSSTSCGRPGCRPALTPRGVAPRRRRPPARLQGVGVARRPPVRHPRRGEGRRQAGAPPPAPAPPRGRDRGHHRRLRPRRHPRLGAGAALIRGRLRSSSAPGGLLRRLRLRSLRVAWRGGFAAAGRVQKRGRLCRRRSWRRVSARDPWFCTRLGVTRRSVSGRPSSGRRAA